MGKAALTVQNYLCDCLSESHPSLTWQTEHRIAGTPVDIVGSDSAPVVLVELEWRRADPADNSAKLFRHLSTEQITLQKVSVIQLFTAYYNLTRGGVSSKRKNAEFVGHVAADTIGQLSYYPIDLNLVPPKRGNTLPENWKQIADDTIEEILDHVTTSSSSL